MARIILVPLIYFICLRVFAGSQVFNVLEYGAVNDGKTISTAGIQRAIDKCSESGGGTVEFPAGRYISGTIFLKSNITLHLSAGSVLEGSKNINDYPVTPYPVRTYTDNYTNKSLIYAEGLKNVAITGEGVINGNGSSFIIADELVKKSLSDSYRARPYIIRFVNCENINIENITLINSPMWVQHYLFCRNVYISGIRVRSQVNRNNDGIDIDACENVRISDCDIISGDDAIVIKSTLDKPCKNVTITNCLISSDCNGFKLGTESNGGFQNITLSNCIVYNTRLAAIALEMVDGGSMSNVTVSGVNMDSVGCVLFIRLGNRARPFKENMERPGMGRLSGIMISNIQATNAGPVGCSITGLPLYPAGNISLRDIRINFTGGGTSDLVSRKIDEFPDKYPEYRMFGMLPAYGFYCRHVTGLSMDNIELSYNNTDYRPPLYFQDVNGATISDIKAFFVKGIKSAVVTDSCRNIKIRDNY